MENRIIHTEKLCKTFSNGGLQQHILKNLDLDIYEGDFTVIMGPSGAGKSTLLYALSGMDKPTLGKIFFRGEDISKFSNDKLALFRRKHCGFIFQQNYLLDNMSIMDNVMACGLLINKKRKEVHSYAKELFELVGISEQNQKKSAAMLSGGEAQRAGIVRALINRPEMIFADEPTGALNSIYSKAVLDVLTDLNQKGQSILMVTHDIKSARRGNRIVYLKDGDIAGICELGKYVSGDQERHNKLTTFLNAKGW